MNWRRAFWELIGQDSDRSYLPFIRWMSRYKASDLPGDIIAGLTVAAMLVPQGMAYALLAGLPPEVGLYASMIPVMLYGLLGSTKTLTLGPTAITSVMVLGTLAPVTDDPVVYLSLAMTLSLILGIILLLMGLLRLGFIVNILSQPVILGYVNAAALVITFSQLQNLLGISVPRTSAPLELLRQVVIRLDETNFTTLGLGIASLALLFFFRTPLNRILEKRGIRESLRFVITRSGPLLVIVLTLAAVTLFDLDTNNGVRVVGAVPTGFPPIQIERFDLSMWQTLLPGAIAIAFVGLMEAISTAKSLTTRGDKLSANQELVAMGAANIGGALTGGFPVTTSISRSAVNFTAGAKTGLSSIIAGSLVAAVVLVLAPVFERLPGAALAAIILISVVNLIDFGPIVQIWRYSQLEALPFIVTFISVFFLNIAVSIMIGVAVAIALYLLRTIIPRVVELGRYNYSDRYQNIADEHSATVSGTLILRIDESLYFANSQYLDRQIRNALVDRPEVDTLILDCSSMNFIDPSSLQILTALKQDLDDAGVAFMMTELRNDIIGRMEYVGFFEQIGRDRFFDTTHEAVASTGRLPDAELPIG